MRMVGTYGTGTGGSPREEFSQAKVGMEGWMVGRNVSQGCYRLGY